MVTRWWRGCYSLSTEMKIMKVTVQPPLQKADDFIVNYLLPLGLFVQMTGIIWLGRGGSVSQTYLWLIFPALISALINWRSWKALKGNPLVILLLLLFAWATLSVSWSNTTDRDMMDVVKRSLFILLYIYAVMRICSQPGKFEKVTLIASAVVAISAAIAIYNTFVVNDAPLSYRAIRLTSMGLSSDKGFADFLHPVIAGIYYGFFTCFLYTYLISKEQTKKTATYAGLCLALTLTYLLFTWSRGPILAALASMGIGTLLIRNKKSNVALVGGLMVAAITLASFWELIFSENVASSSLNGRTYIWEATWNLLSQDIKTLLTGFGFDTQQRIVVSNHFIVDHAHSLPIQVAYLYGLVGFALFAGILLLTAKYIGQAALNKQWQLPLLLFVFGLVAMATDIGNLITRPNQFWLILWIPIGMALALRQQKQTA